MYRIYKIRDTGIKYMISKYMWSNNKSSAQLFETENDAFAWAEDNNIEDYAIESVNIDDGDDTVIKYKDLYQ